jgi:hypothetical protein
MYCEENGSYDLSVKEGTVVLSFAPTFPEAVEKGISILPNVRMTGTLAGDKVEFHLVEIEDQSGQRVRDQKEAELVYRPWLDFIEENY